MEQPSSSDAVAIAQRLVDALGVEAVAHMLDVNTDRLDLWVTGQVPPSDEDRAKLANLDSLVSHLLNVFTPAQARPWLKARTRTLARALFDVYRLEGAGPGDRGDPGSRARCFRLGSGRGCVIARVVS